MEDVQLVAAICDVLACSQRAMSTKAIYRIMREVAAENDIELTGARIKRLLKELEECGSVSFGWSINRDLGG